MSVLKKISGLIVSVFTIYSTPKVVQVENKKIAAFNRIIQLLIFAYVLGFMIIYKKGYQLSSDIQCAVVTKIKGTTRVNITEDNPNLNPKFDIKKLKLYNRVWDGQDLIYPLKESSGFFLTTNLVITKDQKLGTCLDESDSSASKCDPKNTTECKAKQSVLTDGLNTGNCIKSDYLNTTVCEIEGWCPVEHQVLPLKDNYPIFEQIEEFTVLIKETIRFPLFNILKRNIEENKGNKNLKSCNYDPLISPRCPIFKIGDIIRFAGVNFTDISRYGGVIAIQIDWNCDLDWDLSYCFPTYKFSRLDLKNTTVSPGYNFRYSRYTSFDGEEKRDLFKAYGIRFEVLTAGRGKKFSIVPLALNIGSGVGLLALATVVCDFVLLYFTPEKDIYNKKKFLYVDGEITKGNSRSSEINDSIE